MFKVLGLEEYMSVEGFIDTLYGSLFWLSLITLLLIIGYIVYKEITKE